MNLYSINNLLSNSYRLLFILIIYFKFNVGTYKCEI